ncbi:MAG: DUF4876 domain-containing protein [Ignavibacteriaceae bacterium]|nr:DUF4876 domain-containing protein [Ignavibacteriaceae bacterium]
MKKISSVFLFLLLGLISCQEEPPVVPDGNSKINLMALGDTTLVDSIPHFIPMQNAKVILSSEYGLMIKYTDQNGSLILEGLPAAAYSISVRMPHPLNENILLVGNIRDVQVSPAQVTADTIFAEQVANTGIAINEIYAGGPLNNIFFFYDQFIELYNYSDEIKYVDGMIVTRVSGNNDGGQGPGADEGNDGDIDGVTYIFKFPGKPGETNYPFYPHTFLVLASTAVNHKNVVSTSYDLSNADWEFYNQFSASDFDNPNVKNLINIRSDRTVDFLINLVSDVIVLGSGVDPLWEDGLDLPTVIDGVQYKSSVTSRKTLDARVDKGFAQSPPKYSGKSMRRREPGVDTNDATLDWEPIPFATPGFH